ncbi:magnesium/cobalt transporter CorA [Halogeometricum sp. S1BR25-6]|uniref:Magnesium transport protein CorA n=1 Tax=Halogeometricum salsisoli TaxID=2950536 RepID=A0ABU2GDV7_9EURY|nr:magnesium/cobalt transporter CorA [Halogeometricum sp. S1BR25-6]MDS0298995.1 magnesium/cobalt transporter CorA [Halogeometricum sp. S1BR25-6]
MIDARVYDAGGVDTRKIDSEAALERARDAPGTTWVRVSTATEAEMEAVSRVFGIHALELEDVRNDVRPKTEEFPDHTFVLVKAASLRRGETTFDEEVQTKPVGLFVGEEWVLTLTVEDAVVPAVERIWRSIENREGRILVNGPDFAAYRVIDRVIDEYFTLLDDVEDTIEEIEEGVLEGPDDDVLDGLNAVRRDLLSFRKVVWPTREAVSILARGDAAHVREPTEKYYRDVYDHLVEVVDLTETYRDLARGARDIYLSVVSQSTNEVMRRLTVVATIFIPLTFVVGVYGMNFSGTGNMPELTWPYAYPAVMVGMTLVTVILLLYFEREGWL